MSRLRALALLPLLAACADGGPDTPSEADRAERVRTGLRLAVEVEGEPPRTFTVEERLEHYGVPAVSVAVIDSGRIAWARAWGVADTETGAAATPTTLFQAASISKPVAALGALALVDEGRLELDRPVNDLLTSWQVEDNAFTADSAVTLRGLLTHSAGTTVWGFPGYARGVDVPDNVGVLDGLGNTDRVRVYKTPGESWQYSGGGFTVMELLVEDVTGRPFEVFMRERVLEPAGMEHSTFDQPLPESRWSEAARAHDGRGDEIEGEWHTYPEQAAAGLWTTPTDLATLSLHLLGIRDGRIDDGVIAQPTLEAMLSPHHPGEDRYRGWGLGIGLNGEGDARTFGHGGSNAGFRANWITYLERGQGMAVMTNGDRGGALGAEIARAIAAEYGWPDFRPEVRTRVRPDAEVMAALAGDYDIEGSPGTVTLEAGDGELTVLVNGEPQGRLWAESNSVWFDPEDGTEVSFVFDDGGRVVAGQQRGGPRIVRR